MTNTQDQSITHLLLVEACETLTDAVRQALRRSDLDVRLHRVGDPDEALAYLCRTAHYQHAPRPHLVLISPTLPLCTLNDFINELQADSRIPRVSMFLLDDGAVRRRPSVRRRAVRSVSIHSLAGVVRQMVAVSPPLEFPGAP